MAKRQELEKSAQSSGNTSSVVFKPRNHRRTYSRRSGRENQPRAAGIPPAWFSSPETTAKRIPAALGERISPEQREYHQRGFQAPKPSQNVFPLSGRFRRFPRASELWAVSSASSGVWALGATPRAAGILSTEYLQQPRAAGIPPALFSNPETTAKRIPAALGGFAGFLGLLGSGGDAHSSGNTFCGGFGP